MADWQHKISTRNGLRCPRANPGCQSLGLVRGGSRGGAVDGCVGGEHAADHSPAWDTNHDANKGGNSAQRAGGGANPRPDESADYKADQGMLAALGGGGCRDAGNVFAFYRD